MSAALKIVAQNQPLPSAANDNMPLRYNMPLGYLDQISHLHLVPSAVCFHTPTPRGKVTSIINGAISGDNRTYSYDGLGRIISSSGPYGTK